MTTDKDKKIVFTFNIGDGGNGYEEKFTLNELGYDEKTHGNVDDFIEEEWKEWRNNFIDGGWRYEDKITKYKCKRTLGYPVLESKQPKLDGNAEYIIVAYAKACENRPIIERVDGEEFEGRKRWIVDKMDLVEI